MREKITNHYMQIYCYEGKLHNPSAEDKVNALYEVDINGGEGGVYRRMMMDEDKYKVLSCKSTMDFLKIGAYERDLYLNDLTKTLDAIFKNLRQFDILWFDEDGEFIFEMGVRKKPDGWFGKYECAINNANIEFLFDEEVDFNQIGKADWQSPGILKLIKDLDEGHPHVLDI